MFDEDLGSALRASALTHADRPALWVSGERVNYRELFDRAAQLAEGMRRAGVKPGDTIAVLAPKSPAAYAGVLAGLLLGCTYAPLNPLFRPERNGVVFRASGAKVLILGGSCAARLDTFIDHLDNDILVFLADSDSARLDGERRQIGREELPDLRLAQLPEVSAIDRDAAAVLLFTSGTTGTPKGVPISHRNLAAYIGGVTAIVQFDETDRFMQLVGLTFDLSMHDMFLCWLHGAELYSVPENTFSLMPRLVRQHGITTCFVVPSPVARSIQQGQVRPGGMPSMRVTFIAGEALPQTVAQAWCEAAPNTVLFNLYGPTEATVSVTWYRFDPVAEPLFAVVPIGHPFGRERVELFDADMKPVSPGAYGQILLSGDQVCTGYWNAPNLDAEKFQVIDGVRWYKTGDLGRWIEPHGLVFAGRADRQVKIRGYLVDLQEIEGVLRRTSGRQEVAVLAWPLVEQGSYDGSVAFLVGEAVDADGLRAQCRLHVGDYMVPDRIVFVDALPANANGKVDYKVLQQHPALTGAEPSAAQA